MIVRPLLLLITGSLDGTSDRIVARYGAGVFRINYDLWRDYSFSYTPEFWKIVSPSGLEITSKTASAVFWWKAFSYHLSDDKLITSEVKYILRDLYGWFSTRGMAKGNDIDFHNRWGKINILSRAKQYFSIPKTLVSIGLCDTNVLSGDRAVAKSLASQTSGDGLVLMTTGVTVSLLDKQYPWYLQDQIDSAWDVTVFQCGSAFYGFKRSRKGLVGLDWRVAQNFDYSQQEWFLFNLTVAQHERLLSLSAELGVEIGRYDFMTLGDSSEELVFLEFNATGQWVFLDIKDEFGLLDTFVNWLKRPNTRVSGKLN